MTELENHLLTALKSLSAEFNAQLKHSKQAQEELRNMFVNTSTENRELRDQVKLLSQQVNELQRGLKEFGSLYAKNGR